MRQPSERRVQTARTDDEQVGVKTRPTQRPGRSRPAGDEDSRDIDIRQRRRRSRVWLLTGVLAGAGVLTLLVCVGTGVAVYFVFFRPSIVGHWDLTDPQIPGLLTVEFNADGTGTLRGPAADVSFDYTLDRKDPMALEWRITRVEPKNALPVGGRFVRFPMQPMPRLPLGGNMIGLKESFRVKMENNVLTLTPANNNPVLTFRRVR